MEIREQVRHLPGVQVSEVLTAGEVADASERLELRWRQRVFTPVESATVLS